MSILKKNQIIIYTFALMLVIAGYLNYTNNIKDNYLETSAQDISLEKIYKDTKEESANNEMDNMNNKNVSKESIDKDLMNKDNNLENTKNNNDDSKQKNIQMADIGDATLVNSSDIISEETNKNEDNVIKENSKSSIANEQDYFFKSKLDRDTMYSQMIESYEKILNSNNSLETQKQSAIQEITKINDVKNSIMICENLIGTKGFKNSVVFVNGKSISIIIGSKELKPEEIAQIQNIISRELTVNIEDIHISTKE